MAGQSVKSKSIVDQLKVVWDRLRGKQQDSASTSPGDGASTSAPASPPGDPYASTPTSPGDDNPIR